MFRRLLEWLLLKRDQMEERGDEQFLYPAIEKHAANRAAAIKCLVMHWQMEGRTENEMVERIRRAEPLLQRIDAKVSR